MGGRVKLLYKEGLVADKAYTSRYQRNIIIDEWRKLYGPKFHWHVIQINPDLNPKKMTKRLIELA